MGSHEGFHEASRAVPYEVIDETAALKAFLGRLEACPDVAVDTEANSLHHYRERVSLIQLTGRERGGALHHAIVDPIADVDVMLLGPLLADPKVTTIFHGADYDVVSLRRDYGFAFANIYDTMVAARCAGVPRFGLADLVQGYFGVALNKRYQKIDWSHRPLSREALDYAHLDTRYLPEIMDRLRDLVAQKGRTDAVEEECRLLEQRAWVRREPDPEAFLQVKGATRLGDQGRRVLRELWEMREGIAKKRDWPPFKVMGNETLIALATAAPGDAKSLESALGRHSRIGHRYGPRILDAVATGLVSDRPLPAPRRGDGRRPTREDDALFKHLKDWRNAAAEAEGVEPSMVVSNQVLQEVSTRRPAGRADLEAIPGIRRWQLARYADALVAEVQAFAAAG